jgi:hypothetical protein
MKEQEQVFKPSASSYPSYQFVWLNQGSVDSIPVIWNIWPNQFSPEPPLEMEVATILSCHSVSIIYIVYVSIPIRLDQYEEWNDLIDQFLPAASMKLKKCHFAAKILWINRISTVRREILERRHSYLRKTWQERQTTWKSLQNCNWSQDTSGRCSPNWHPSCAHAMVEMIAIVFLAHNRISSDKRQRFNDSSVEFDNMNS